MSESLHYPQTFTQELYPLVGFDDDIPPPDRTPPIRAQPTETPMPHW